MEKTNKHANTNLIYMVFDVLYSIVAYIVTTMIYSGGRTIFSPYHFGMCCCFTMAYILANNNKKIYNTTLFFYADRIVKFITRSFIFSCLVTCVPAYFVGGAEEIVPLKFFYIFIITEYVFMIISAFLTRFIVRTAGWFMLNTIFVGSATQYEKVIRFINKSNMGVVVKGYVVEGETVYDGDTTEYLGTISELEDIIHRCSVDQVFFMQHTYQTIDYEKYIDLCMTLGVTVRLINHPYLEDHAQNYVCSIGTYPTVTYHRVVLDVYSRAIKRTFDVVLSIIGIILSSPIMLVTAIAIKLDSKGPVIFKQERVGKNGRRFHMYKFRSMCINADEMKAQLQEQNEIGDGMMFKIKDDPRITKVGKFIRKTSIDELPQFFNVLVGTMSLVGTRPPTLDEVEKYATEHWRRLSMRPGITGMWQVSGRSTITDFDEVVALDTKYIDNWSVWLDLKIMVMTVLQVIVKKPGAF